MKKLGLLMLSLFMIVSSYTSVPDGALKGVLSSIFVMQNNSIEGRIAKEYDGCIPSLTKK